MRTAQPALADELRDGLLQDLLASSLLLEYARRSLPIDGDQESEAMLTAAAAALHEDIERVRRLITRLQGHEAA
ncbi:MAG: histidine kinase [Chloroflexi bacterium]|nr:histidine kinase [Chloroflexota bacterium]MDA1240223.1 histidine kinase [Chloroflexota bacterium]